MLVFSWHDNNYPSLELSHGNEPTKFWYLILASVMLFSSGEIFPSTQIHVEGIFLSSILHVRWIKMDFASSTGRNNVKDKEKEKNYYIST